VSTLDSPERPEGLPERTPPEPRPWSVWWSLPVALGAVVAGGICLAIAIAIHDAIVELPAHRDGVVGVALHGTPPVITLVATLAQDLALVAGAILAAAASLKGRFSFAAFGLVPARLASSAAYVIAAYVVFLLLAAAWTQVMGVQDRETVAIDLGTRDSTFALVAAGFLVCVVAPIAEELFFRGFLFGALRKHGLVIAALVSGVTFGLVHVASSPIGFIVPLAGLGVILALLYERTGSLYPPIALHALNNSIAFGVSDGRPEAIPVCLAAAAVTVYGIARLVGRSRPVRTVVPTT
jgi:hypothetical protein